MYYVAIFLILLLAVVVVLLCRGTTFKKSKAGIRLGFCSYTAKQMQGYNFMVEKEWLKPWYGLRKRCFVKVEVFEGQNHVRTHLIARQGDEAADKLAWKMKTALAEHIA